MQYYGIRNFDVFTIIGFLMLLFACGPSNVKNDFTSGEIEIIDSFFLKSTKSVRFLNYSAIKNKAIFAEGRISELLIGYDFTSGIQDTLILFADVPGLSSPSILTANYIDNDLYILTSGGFCVMRNDTVSRLTKMMVAQQFPTNKVLVKLQSNLNELDGLMTVHQPYAYRAEPRLFGFLNFKTNKFEALGQYPNDLPEAPVDGHILFDSDDRGRKLHFIMNPYQKIYTYDLSKTKENSQMSYTTNVISLDKFNHPHLENKKYELFDVENASQIYDLFYDEDLAIVHYSDDRPVVLKGEEWPDFVISLYDSTWRKISVDLVLPKEGYHIETRLIDGRFLMDLSEEVEYTNKTRFDIVEITFPL